MLTPPAVRGEGSELDLAQELGALVRDWGLREVRPRIRALEEAAEFPRATYLEMGRLGLFGCCFPERLGGNGARSNVVKFCTARDGCRYRLRIGPSCW